MTLKVKRKKKNLKKKGRAKEMRTGGVGECVRAEREERKKERKERERKDKRNRKLQMVRSMDAEQGEIKLVSFTS